MLFHLWKSETLMIISSPGHFCCPLKNVTLKTARCNKLSTRIRSWSNIKIKGLDAGERETRGNVPKRKGAKTATRSVQKTGPACCKYKFIFTSIIEFSSLYSLLQRTSIKSHSKLPIKIIIMM